VAARPEPDAHWQESVVLCFQDIEQGLGGFIRIGHHPNLGTGNCTFGVVAPGVGYNRSRIDVPMREGDRFANGFAIDGFLTATFDSATNRWTAEDRDCALDLHVENLHPHYDAWALSGLTGGFREKFAAMHTEVAGRVRGTMRIGDRTWTVDGFGHRDHRGAQARRSRGRARNLLLARRFVRPRPHVQHERVDHLFRQAQPHRLRDPGGELARP
jgi:hypothetical protein